MLLFPCFCILLNQQQAEHRQGPGKPQRKEERENTRESERDTCWRQQASKQASKKRHPVITSARRRRLLLLLLLAAGDHQGAPSRTGILGRFLSSEWPRARYSPVTLTTSPHTLCALDAVSLGTLQNTIHSQLPLEEAVPGMAQLAAYPSYVSMFLTLSH